MRENVRARKARRIVFSIVCPGNRRQHFCFSNRLKSRRNFRSQIQFRSFHAAKTRNGHRPESKTLNGDVRSQSAPEHLLRSSATSLSSSSTTCGGNCSEAGHLHEFFGIPRSLNLNRRRRILNFSQVVGGEFQ